MAHLATCFNDEDSMQTDDTILNSDYLPAVVTKSNSLMSNECLTSRSSFDTDLSLPFQPSTGLKLVLKRQSHNANAYEIKTNVQLNGLKLNSDSLKTENQNANNVLPNGKRIPRRQSARRVKFIFSDQESEDDEKTSRQNKRIKQGDDLTSLSLTTNSIKPMINTLKTVSPTYQNIESANSDDEYFQELLRKNMPQSQNVSPIPNAIQLAQNHFLQNKLFVNKLNKVNETGSLNPSNTQLLKTRGFGKETLTTQQAMETNRPKRKTLRKNKKSVSQRARPVQSTKKIDIETKSEQLVVEFKAAPKGLFLKEELIKSTLLEKHKILNNQPVVLMEHSKPFPIALVESETNIVETKAVLFMHLFQSLSSPCIGCPECSNFMTCSDFSKHIHIDEEDDEILDMLKKPKVQKSYKILPYRMNENEELSENDMNIWREFGRRCAQFKQNKQKTESEKTILVTRDINNNDVLPIVNMKSNQSSKAPDMNTLEFEEWDSRLNEKFIISKERFERDQICTVKYEEACKENVHYFMEEKEDLLLSEDDSDSQISFGMMESFQHNSFESSEERKVTKCPIKQLLYNMIDQVTKCSRDNLQLSEMEITKQRLLTKSIIIPENESISLNQKPTILEKYFNLYDNLTTDVLLYICDNSLTVIPDSYVLYINSKREINLKKLKLAKTSYHHGKWLEQILDLECKFLSK